MPTEETTNTTSAKMQNHVEWCSENFEDNLHFSVAGVAAHFQSIIIGHHHAYYTIAGSKMA